MARKMRFGEMVHVSYTPQARHAADCLLGDSFRKVDNRSRVEKEGCMRRDA